jgi:hypothetical protein
MVVVVLVCNFLLVAVLMTLFVKGCCKRHHLDEKIIRMIASRKSAVSRRNFSLDIGQSTINQELELKELEGEVKTKEKDEDMSAVKTGFTNPMFSGPVQMAAMALPPQKRSGRRQEKGTNKQSQKRCGRNGQV